MTPNTSLVEPLQFRPHFSSFAQTLHGSAPPTAEYGAISWPAVAQRAVLRAARVPQDVAVSAPRHAGAAVLAAALCALLLWPRSAYDTLGWATVLLIAMVAAVAGWMLRRG